MEHNNHWKGTQKSHLERPTTGQMGKRSVISARRQVDVCEFKASLIYRVSARTVRATQKNPISKRITKNPNKVKKNVFSTVKGWDSLCCSSHRAGQSFWLCCSQSCSPLPCYLAVRAEAVTESVNRLNKIK